jgi:PAS domain S-box-containing protein
MNTAPNITLSLTLLIPAVACAGFAVCAARRRTAPGAGPFALVMASASWWSLWYAVELLTVDLPRQLFWTKLQYVGIATLPVAWLVFAVHHAGLERLLTRGRVALLLVVPAAVLVAAWTNNWHHLMWVQVWPSVHGALHTYVSVRGPVYWLNVAYGQMLVAVGTFLVALAALRAPRAYRGQSLAVLLGVLAPWSANVLYLMGLVPAPGFDPTPHAFIVTGVLVIWGLSRLHFLGLMPVARESVVASMRDGVLVLDEGGRVLEANPAARELLGPIRPGTPVAQVLPGPLPGPEARTSGQPAEMLLPLNGTDRYLELTISDLTVEVGRIRGSVILIRDATRRRRAEIALREALQRFEAVVQHAPVAIQGFDREGHILHWNHASEVLYGCSAEEAIGQLVCTLLVDEGQREAFCRQLARVWEEGLAPEPREWEVRTGRNEKRLVYSSMFPVREGGKVVEVFCMEVDVTERRQVERAERLAAVGQLAAGVAHEFNNLLAAMMLRAEMTDVSGSRGAAELVDVVLKSARRGAETCRNLMAFARPRPPRRGPVRPEESVEAALRIAARQLENAQVQVTRTYRSAGSKSEGDSGQLEQVFLNLIINACHAMSGADIPVERRRLSVSISEEVDSGSPWLVVAISDTGAGIRAEDLPHIFEPFFTTKRDSGEGAGTGLGLPVSQGIVEAHGGHMEASSTPGEGARFEVWLPAVSPVQSAPEPAESRSKPLPPPPNLDGARVLVAEDDDEVRDLLVELLADCGAQVTAANATEEALRAFEQGDHDLVLTDIMMPGGGGEELLAAVTGSDRAVPVVVITGKADAMLEDRLPQLGAAAVLRKPFSISDVYQTAAALLSS